MKREKYSKWEQKLIAGFLAMMMILTTVFTNNVVSMAVAPAVILSSKSETIAVGKSVQLKVKSAKGLKSKAVTWKSSNSKVAKVTSKGKVTGVAQGDVKITATSKSNKKVKATCKITVKKDAVQSIKLDKTACVIVKGKNAKVKVVGVEPVAASSKVTWKINKSSIGKVTVKGNTATVKGKKAGKATLTATTTDGSKKTAKVDIVVVNKKTHIKKVSQVKVSLTQEEMFVGESTTAKAVVSPKQATLKKVCWSVSDSEVAKIDDVGKIIALKAGIVKVIATAQDGSGKKATVTLTVKEKLQPTTIPTQQPEVTATVSPTGNPEKDTWEVHTAEEFSGGNGTEASPYLISTPEELALMAKYVNQSDKKYKSAYYKLIQDIDISAYEWVPIGIGGYEREEAFAFEENEISFVGHFDGANHCITGLKILSNLKIYYYGLFGCVDKGTVKNVVLENVQINVTSELKGDTLDNGMTSWYYIGGLAGSVTGAGTKEDLQEDRNKCCGTVENCTVKAKISLTTAQSIAGGVAIGAINYGNVSKITANGEICGKSAKAIKLGGFVGSVANEAIVSEAVFHGKVVSENIGTLENEQLGTQGYSYLHYCGGFAGSISQASFNQKVSDCYAVAEVQARGNETVDAGGFVGYIGQVYGLEMKHLYCQSKVSVTDSNGEAVFQDFSKSAVVFGNDVDIEISYCSYINDGKICILKDISKGTEETSWLYFETIQQYAVEETDIKTVYGTILNFDTEVWNIEGQAFPILKIEGKIPVITPIVTPTSKPEATLTATPTRQPEVSEIPTETWCESIEDAGKLVREEMKKRSQTIKLNYKTRETISDGSMLNKIMEEALIHTGVSTEGDYLKWQMENWNATVEGKLEDKINYLTITYSMNYYTNIEQETEVDFKIATVQEQLNLQEKSDYQKIKAIYDYICCNVTYDYINLNDDSYKLKYTAYAALVNGNSVCQGYANLLYRLLLEAGIDCRIITGVSNGEAHAWNIVKLNDTYYYLDSTWDAQREKYSYFLKGTTDFDSHTSNGEYITEEFQKAYPIADSKYVASSTDNGVIEIRTEEELVEVANNLAGKYIMVNDIELSATEWESLGDFQGEFDGNGYKITNLTST